MPIPTAPLHLLATRATERCTTGTGARDARANAWPGRAARLARWLAALAMAAALGGLHAQPAQGQPQQLPTITLQAGMHNIRAQVAATFEQRQTGLMYRREMPVHEGMLFVFDEPGQQCFWMRNTLIPLTAAFVADDGTIVNLADMQPLTEAPHCSAAAVRFVLEMNQGWFAKRGLKPGFRLIGPPFTRAPS